MADPITSSGDVFAVPLSALPADIRDQQTAEMRTLMPAWRPVPGAPDTNMLASSAQVSAESRAALNDRLANEIRELLGSIFGVPRGLGTPAGSTITLTAIDTAGHQLDAGATVFLGDAELETIEDLDIAAGTSTGSVAVQTIEFGADFNDLAGDVELDSLDWLAEGGVALDAPLSGGTDPETIEAYDLRLRDEMRILSPTPVTAENVAIYVRRNPAVGWAWAIKGYDADTGLSDQARTVTAVVATAVGGTLLDPVLETIRADLVVRRETNWNVFVVSPSYVTVAVTATVVIDPEHDKPTVLAGVQAALQAVLAPGGWMRPQAGDGTPANFQPERTIHKNALIAEAAQVDGVSYIKTLQIGDGSSDHVTLSTPRELPQAGTITVTEAP
jgi:hypothetical protein